MSKVSHDDTEEFSSIPRTMKCALIARQASKVHPDLVRVDTQPIPKRTRSDQLLINVRAVALAPGDVRVVTGECSLFQSPGNFPYIPGGDLAGTVVETSETSRFQVGDEIISMFQIPKPLNAEYAVVSEKLTEIKPLQLSWDDAACLTSSAVAAHLAAKLHLNESQRVLILGAGGGVGRFLIQMAKIVGCWVATTSTDTTLQDLGADEVIDYRTENWWERPEFQDDPLDIVFDLGVGGQDAWYHAKSSQVLKKASQGGKYISFSPPNPNPVIRNPLQLIGMTLNIVTQSLMGKLWDRPEWIWHSGLDLQPGTLEEILDLVMTGKLRIEQDPISPLTMTKEDIVKGLELMQARRAHGKVVILVNSSFSSS